MSALGKYVLECGGELYGYDAVRSEKTAELEKAGAKIYSSVAVKEEEKALINSSEIIVCTSAISKENARFEECVAQGKNVTYRGEFLGEIARTFPRVVSVAGSHGKTTCTSMCAHIFFSAGKGFTAHIGGDDVSFGNYYRSGDDYFLTEACEYKKNLLYVRPSVAVLLNIDRDHLECYRGEEELTQTFLKYCSAGKTALICADDPKIAAAHLAYPTFGINSENACFTAKSIINDRERYSFDFCEHGKTICRVKLKAAGRCHILNALAAGGAALIEQHTGAVICAKEAHKKLPMASTTKIMTALIVIENCSLGDTVKVSPKAYGVEGSSMYLNAGEEVSVEDMLYGLMLLSGNDAAVALAIHTAGSVEAFAALMNARAEEIGAHNTNFVTRYTLYEEQK